MKTLLSIYIAIAMGCAAGISSAAQIIEAVPVVTAPIILKSKSIKLAHNAVKRFYLLQPAAVVTTMPAGFVTTGAMLTPLPVVKASKATIIAAPAGVLYGTQWWPAGTEILY